MSTTVRDIAATIEQGIADVDRQLSQLQRTRKNLEQALAELSNGADDATPSRPARPRRRPSHQPRRASTGATATARRRAPRGQNREVILAFLQDNGPAPASAIAKQTGVNRGVVYTNLTQLIEEQRVEQGSADGKTVFGLTA